MPGRSDVGRLLPDYDLGSEIGRGEDGSVWRAHHRQLDRPVAVKQLATTSADDTARFRREAQILARLDHPHVVKVYDYREDDATRLFVMELLDAGTVGDRIRRGCSAESAVAMALAAASGLHHVHQHGVLHRDVKPENLMFDGRGTLKVTDFGIARADRVEAGAEATVTGSFLGTPAFVSPEQAGAAFGAGWPPLTGATDQYSLAAVLFRALSGRLTHDDTGGALALCQRRIDQEARDLARLVPTLPPKVAGAVMVALKRRPEERFASCEAFGVALAVASREAFGPDWLSRSDVQVRDPGPILSAALGPPARSTTGPPRPEPTTRAVHPVPAPPPPPRPVPAPTAPDPAPSASRRALWFVVAGLGLVVALAAAGLVLQRGSGRGPGRAAAVTTTTAERTPLDLRQGWVAPTGGKVFSSPAVAPAEGDAGPVAVVGSDDGSVYAFDPATGREVWKHGTGAAVQSSPAVSGDTAYVASRDGYLYALGLADGAERWKVEIGFEVVSSPAVSGDTVVIGADQLRAYDRATGARRWAFPTRDVIVSSPAVSGETVVVGSNDGSVYAVDLADGAQRWSYRTGDKVLSSPAVSGDTVVVGSNDTDLYAFDLSSGDVRWAATLGSPVVSSPAISGATVVVGTDSGRLVGLDLASGAVRWRFDTGDTVHSSPAVVGDLVVVGSADGAVYAVTLADGSLAGKVQTDGPVRSSPAASGDDTVIVGSDDSGVYEVRGLASPGG